MKTTPPNNSASGGIMPTTDDGADVAGLSSSELEHLESSLVDYGTFIHAGASRQARRDRDAWEIGQVLALMVARYRIAVGRGRPVAPGPDADEPHTLSDVARDMGLSSQQASRFFLNADFYPQAEWRLDLPFSFYTLARQSAPDLESALELLDMARLHHMGHQEFALYCAGEFYNGVWPEGVDIPAAIRRLAPNQDDIEFRLVIRRRNYG